MLNFRKISNLPVLFMMVCAFLFSVNTFAQQTIDMKGTDKMRFSVEEIAAKPGEEITVKLTTDSNLPAVAMSHNFVLLNQGVDAKAFSMASAKYKDNDYIDPAKESDVIAHTKMASGGQTVEVTFKAPSKAGEYEYVCTFPGHYISKMKGILTVK